MLYQIKHRGGLDKTLFLHNIGMACAFKRVAECDLIQARVIQL